MLPVRVSPAVSALLSSGSRVILAIPKSSSFTVRALLAPSFAR
ncbi:MAG: hypothetical protein QM820_09930 [Minicystis sp.]